MFTETLIQIVRLLLRQGRYCTFFDNLFKSMFTLSFIEFDVISYNLDFPVLEIVFCLFDKDRISKKTFLVEKTEKGVIIFSWLCSI